MRLQQRYAALLVGLIALTAGAGCDFAGGDFLDRKPTDILLDDQVWNSPALIQGVLANYYSRMPDNESLDNNYHGFAQLDDAMWSGYNNDPNTFSGYGYDWWRYWDYNLIRHVNLFVEKIDGATALNETDRKVFKAEARFIRAYLYFEMVKRMGGVPLITQTYEYDFSGNPDYLQFPRATEAEVYDFVISEVDAIKADLPDNNSVTRANKWTALALKSRAALYAGSIARYNALKTPQVTLPGNEVGIPASRAQGYYQASLDASKEIIAGGRYSLYTVNPDKRENFYEAIVSKTNNSEVMWVEDFTLEGRYHNWVYENIPRSLREDNESSSSISPSLNLVEAFEYVDGSKGDLRTMAGGDYVYYDSPDDIFAGKDPRLWGTVIYPGSTFRGKPVSIQAGVMVWNAGTGQYDIVTGSQLGSEYADGGLLTGADGPLSNEFFVSNTGFYIRKYLDPRQGSGQRGTGTDVWWIRFRYAEVLLNAAEAAFELGQTGDALGYVNQVRSRAGIAPLASLTIQDFQNERRVEFAFEGHRLWDAKRWRIAHEIWNGDPNSETAMVRALYPYRVVRPGDPAKNNKYVFRELVAPRVTQPRFFRLGNYYTEIAGNVLTNNPKIVRNPTSY